VADTNEKAAQERDTVLVARVTVHLATGESFELLPFEDENDVKAKVSDLLADWAKSGFLIRGSEIIPWNQVQRVEATDVEELSRDESALRRKEWESRETARLQQSFWKTKKAREKKEEGDEQESQPRAAA
jgi:hypothetical protein